MDKNAPADEMKRLYMESLKQAYMTGFEEGNGFIDLSCDSEKEAIKAACWKRVVVSICKE